MEVNKVNKVDKERLHGFACFEFSTPWGAGGCGITAIQSFTVSLSKDDK